MNQVIYLVEVHGGEFSDAYHHAVKAFPTRFRAAKFVAEQTTALQERLVLAAEIERLFDQWSETNEIPSLPADHDDVGYSNIRDFTDDERAAYQHACTAYYDAWFTQYSKLCSEHGYPVACRDDPITFGNITREPYNYIISEVEMDRFVSQDVYDELNYRDELNAVHDVVLELMPNAQLINDGLCERIMRDAPSSIRRNASAMGWGNAQVCDDLYLWLRDDPPAYIAHLLPLTKGSGGLDNA